MIKRMFPNQITYATPSDFSHLDISNPADKYDDAHPNQGKTRHITLRSVYELADKLSSLPLTDTSRRG